MHTLFLLALVSFCLSFVLTPFCRNLAVRCRLMDRPDNKRKMHASPVPRIGGVPIALAYAASFLILMLDPRNAKMLELGLPYALRLLPAVGLIFLTGLVDDIWGLDAEWKLVGQCAAGALAVVGGLHISVFGHQPAPWIDVPLTILWLIACSNAFNLIDGVDGLASGVGLFATITTLVAAMIGNNLALAAVTLPLAGALLGFLRYNFNPASIFLGDSGSLLIGFLLGCFGILWSQKSATLLGMVAPMMALSIPLLDAGISVVRRFLRGQPIFTADRGHIHHRLLDRGFTPRRVALLLYGVCALAATLSIMQWFAKGNMSGVVVLLFCGAAWIGIQHLGYAEFALARRLLTSGMFQDTLSAQMQVRALEQSLEAAPSLDACFDIIRDACLNFDFVEIRLRVGGDVWQENLRAINGDASWHLRIPLASGDYINFTRLNDSSVLPMGVAPFMDVIQRTMIAKCQTKQVVPMPDRSQRPRTAAASSPIR
jgi:UDP-GlcNAc:undecaprenyl-phosphate/decaprenyl-phosphate GlcNAc-1-phosphate transferase